MFAVESDGQLKKQVEDNSENISSQKRDGAKEGQCPYCATTREEFYKTGLVGCEYCYTFFRADVERIVEKIQAGTCYDSYKNLTPDEKSEYYKKRKALNARYAQAVRERDYGAACDIREELKKINKILLRGKNAND